jgi:hypothetical protein
MTRRNAPLQACLHGHGPSRLRLVDKLTEEERAALSQASRRARPTKMDRQALADMKMQIVMLRRRERAFYLVRDV